jgi:hypothetical protein
MLIVAHEHDSVSGRDHEVGHEAYERGEGQDASGGESGDDPSDEPKGRLANTRSAVRNEPKSACRIRKIPRDGRAF